MTLRFFGVSLLESFHTAGGIDQFLFAGKEGMAMGTDSDRNLVRGRKGLDDMPTDTGDLDR